MARVLRVEGISDYVGRDEADLETYANLGLRNVRFVNPGVYRNYPGLGRLQMAPGMGYLAVRYPTPGDDFPPITSN